MQLSTFDVSSIFVKKTFFYQNVNRISDASICFFCFYLLRNIKYFPASQKSQRLTRFIFLMRFKEIIDGSTIAI